MDKLDMQVLDECERLHDRIDEALGSGQFRRAEKAGELHYSAMSMSVETDEQVAEIQTVRYRIYTELLDIPSDRATTLLGRMERRSS